MKRCFLVSLLCFWGISFVSSFIQAEFFLQDLERITETKFIKETDSWSSSVTLASSLKFFDCAGTFLLGGYNWKKSGGQIGEYLSRSYTNLPAHKRIVYSFTFWALDTWDPGLNTFQIQFDSLTAIQGFMMDYSTFPSYLCGRSSSADAPGIKVFGRIAHTLKTLSMKFLYLFDENTTNESLGIRDISIFFINDDFDDGDYICGYAGSSIPLYWQETCACEPGKYSSESGCMSCSKEYSSCYDLGADRCYQCADGYYFNGKKCVKCGGSSCLHCTGSKDDQCIECDSDFVLFNGACIAESRCSGEFTLEEDPGECYSPCSDKPESKWNESCYPPCPDSEVSDLNGQCFACESLSTQYLKATDSGHQYRLQLSPSSCDLDIKTVKRYLTITEKTVGSVGSFSFQVTKTGANNYLINLILDESVLKATSFDVKISYLEGSLEVPKKFVPDETLKAISEAIPAAKAAVAGIMGGSLVGTLALGATASLWSIASFQQFVGYFLFINVEYPFQTELFFSLLQISPWDSLPNPLLSLTRSLGESIVEEDKVSVTPYDPPEKFLNYDWTSFFIENGGTTIALNCFLLVLLAAVLYLKKLEKLKKSFIMIKIKVFLKWNFIGRTFLESAIPLSLAVFLQIRVMIFKNPYVILCICFALLSAAFILGMIVFFAKSLFHRDNEHLNQKYVKKIFGTFYEGISLSGSRLSKFYNIIILLRGILITFLVSFLQATPALQIIPLILFNACLVYYLFKAVKFEDRTLNWIIRLKEILILLAEFCILFLCAKEESEKYYQIFGYLVVLFLGSALLIELGYLLILQVYQIKEIGKKLKYLWRVVLLLWKYMKPNKRNKKITKVRSRGSSENEQPSEIICIESIS